MVFTSVGHLINEEMLIECHRDMDGDKAVGIDGVTKEMYGDNLEANVKALVERLKRKSYKPQPARRVRLLDTLRKSYICGKDLAFGWRNYYHNSQVCSKKRTVLPGNTIARRYISAY